MDMVSITKVKNVRQGEAVFRIVLGVILIVIAFFVWGVTGFVLGLIGVVFILTALFGY
jgi:predicted phage tail protein